MAVVRLALLSLRNRWLTALLAVLAITLSVTLFLGVERVRISAKSSFADTISGTDLIVGARAGDVQLLLYSVFRIGNATRNITMQSLADIRARPEVAWVIPLSLGDSHRGFRVLGDHGRLLPALSLSQSPTAGLHGGRTLRRSLRRGGRCGCRRPTGLSAGRSNRRPARHRLVAGAGSRRQALPHRRRPCEDRHPGRSHRAPQSGRRSRPFISTGKAAPASRAQASAPIRCASCACGRRRSPPP